MKTKTAQAAALFNSGNIKGALRIFKTFRSGLSKAEKRTIEIAYEWLTGKSNFYAAIGIDGNKEIDNAIQIIKDYLK